MRWVIFGILSAILFGFWGLFDKLSSSINPFTSNIILYIFAFLFSLIILLFYKNNFKFSKYSLIAGVCAGIGNFFVIYALVKSMLILVLPFVSFAGVVFFILMYFIEKPKYKPKQKILLILGIILSIIGIFIVSTGSIGLFNFFKQLIIEKSYIVLALLISLSYGFWTFFTYKSVGKEKINAATYIFWLNGAAFVLSIIAVYFFNVSSFSELKISLDFIYPAVSGICVAFGTFFTYLAFKTTTTKTKIQEVIVAILANGELIPLLFLSYFVLGEWVPEGFIGVIIVLAGLFIINFAEASK